MKTIKELFDLLPDWNKEFLPRNGMCFSCGKQIFTESSERRIDCDGEITGCPHCKYSFVC